MSRPLLLFCLACLLVAAACGGAGGRPGPPGSAVVVDVIDGDTIHVDVGGAAETVRLIGIDTPETVAPDRPVECHGPEASAALAELLPPGTVVRLERDAEPRDRFGRLLAYVFRDADGLFVNEAMARDGHADVLAIPPNTVYDDRIATAVATARAAGAGLWGRC